MKTREFDAVVRKLGFTNDNTHHKMAWLIVDGRKILRTRRSHGRGDAPMEHSIRKQMKLSDEQMNGAIACWFGYEEYLEHLREIGAL